MAKQTDPRLIQAMQALASGQAQDAESLCNAVLLERKRDDLALALNAQACNQLGKYDDAMHFIRAAIAKNGKRPDYFGLLADMQSMRGSFREAIATYDKALKLNPNHHGAIAGKANTWLRLNEPSKARKLVEPIEQTGHADLTITLVLAKAMIEEGDPMSAAELLLKRLPAEQEPNETRRSLYFVLGKAMELSGEYQSAFEAYEEGNALSTGGFNAAAWTQQCKDITSVFPHESFQTMPRANADSSHLVFIVGMLRSGSTLTEQIIDAHPDGQGLGEVEFLQHIIHNEIQGKSFSEVWPSLTSNQLTEIATNYLDATTELRTSDVIVDKQLGNFMFVGAIAQLFPHAKIIHCTRDPLSMGLSCFAQKLPPNTNPWASSFEDIGHFYKGYHRLMEHWKTLLSTHILSVPYEELVTNQRAMTKRILEYIELPFDEGCMRFWESGRTVLTLSQDQVRRPLYTHAIARSENFGTLLDPLRKSLSI